MGTYDPLVYGPLVSEIASLVIDHACDIDQHLLSEKFNGRTPSELQDAIAGGDTSIVQRLADFRQTRYDKIFLFLTRCATETVCHQALRDLTWTEPELESAYNKVPASVTEAGAQYRHLLTVFTIGENV